VIVPRLRAKTDRNQAAIVQALRDFGCSVVCLHQLGGGIPDLLVATPSGETLLVEVKSAKGSLTPEQVQWISRWQGRVEIIRDPDEISRLLG
jgi:Holliday junction resolvase